MDNQNFSFSINTKDYGLAISKVFNAPLEQVWQAWTKSSLLDQWWAPKPYVTQTKTQFFEPGGIWLYAMVSPDGDKHWCRADYHHTDELKSFSYTDAFCNEEGKPNANKPRSTWTITFEDKGETTAVNLEISHRSSADLAEMLNMGFKEGFSMAIENLDALLLNSAK